MGETRRLGKGCTLLRGDEQQARYQERRGPHVIMYGLISGGIAAITGTATSLAVAGSARIAAWSVVTVSVSVLAGLAYGSAPVDALWVACRQLLRRLVGS
jgi:hypothetical protein